MPNLPPISHSFARIQNWALKHVPEITFRPAADLTAINNFIEKSSLVIPEDLRHTLQIADGETRKSAGIIGNWRLMSVAEIQAAWGLLTKLAEIGAFSDQKAVSTPYIRDTWWDAGWIPVVTSDTGDYICVDTHPPEPERTGQVLIFLQNLPDRCLVAGSLRAWFFRIAEDLDAGVYSYDPVTGFDGEAFLWSSLEGKHLLDDVEGKLIA